MGHTKVEAGRTKANRVWVRSWSDGRLSPRRLSNSKCINWIRYIWQAKVLPIPESHHPTIASTYNLEEKGRNTKNELKGKSQLDQAKVLKKEAT